MKILLTMLLVLGFVLALPARADGGHTTLYKCAAIDTGAGRLYYVIGPDKKVAQRQAVRKCEIYQDPLGPIGTCFAYGCKVIQGQTQCEINSNDPGAEMFLPRGQQ